MILATVIEGTLRVYHRAESGALNMVAQLSGAKPDPNTVAAIVSDLELAFDWTPMDLVPPKRALPKPKAPVKREVKRRTRQEIAQLQADVLDAILHAPRDVRELADQFDVPTHVIEHRVRTLAAQGVIVRVEYEPGRYRYHPAEGGDDGAGVAADDARDGV